MNDAEKFDACIKVAEIAAGRLDFRRQLEWRLCIAIWTALIAAIAWFKVSMLPLWFGTAILLAHGYWLQSLFARHTEDTKILWHYFNEAQAILAKQDISRVEGRPDLRIGSESKSAWRLVQLARTKAGFFSSWALGFEFFVTLVLTAVVYLVCAEQITWLVLKPLP